MFTFLVILLMLIIALAVGGLKVVATAFIVVALVAVIAVAIIVGGFHKLADQGDEIINEEYEQREKGDQSEG